MSLWSIRSIPYRCKQRINPPLWRRLYSATTAVESVTVPCRSNGEITLDLHYSTDNPPAKNSSQSVLLYLPHGPSGENTERDASNISILRSTVQCPIAKINYRLSEQYKYPTPVHDVLAAFDWIIDNLLPKRGITRAGRSESVGQMAVCGEYTGGGLATALALTECRAGQPGIVASVVNNPIVDWVSIEQELKSKMGPRSPKFPTVGGNTFLAEVERLRRLRARLFRKPEHYFDPFASPILFFRSAGAEVPPPLSELPIDELEQLSLLDREESNRRESDTIKSDPISGLSREDQRSPAIRKASKRFPAKALSLRLPEFYISTGTTTPLRTQSEELAHVLRQSFTRQAKYATQGPSDFGRKVLLDNEYEELDEEQQAEADKQLADAKEKVGLHVDNGSGSWSAGLPGEARLRKAAEWLRDKLGQTLD